MFCSCILYHSLKHTKNHNYLLVSASVREVVSRVLNVFVIETEVDEDGYRGRYAVVDGVSEHRHVELVGGVARASERPCKGKGALCIHA